MLVDNIGTNIEISCYMKVLLLSSGILGCIVLVLVVGYSIVNSLDNNMDSDK